MMTPRERILAVYNGKTPDRIPYMLDLSHYYYHRFQKDWDLCYGYPTPEKDMIDFNRKMGAAFYMPNQATFFSSHMANGVKANAVRRVVNGVPEISWQYDTPLGSIERIRVWEPTSYSWAIKKWGVTNEKELEILAYAMNSVRYDPLPKNYDAWADYVGEDGVVYIGPGYSAIGYLYNYWMGVENTIYASYDMEDELKNAVDKINEAELGCLRMLASEYNAPVIILGDNFSSDIQPPAFFDKWSRPYYTEAIKIAHSYGKKVAVHVDGKLSGALTMIRDAGADAIDAVTPGSVGGYNPAQCREEAGSKLILSGGIPNELWYPYSSMEMFEKAVKDWIALKDISPAIIAAAGDQVPPGAEEAKILRMTELVNEYGWYK